MAYKVTDYLQMLLNLLPKGKAWSRSPDSLLYKLMHGHAVELNRLDARTDDLKIERRGGRSNELLPDHEKDLGLPDDCTQVVQTFIERQNAVRARIIDEGGLHKQSYIDFAADLGWTIEITTFKPFICGDSECNDECGDSENIFYWQVDIEVGVETNLVYFNCGESECGDLLIDSLNSTILICFLNKYKPAHTEIIYTFSGPGFSSGFSSGFDSVPSDDPSLVQGGFSRGFSSGFDRYIGGGSFDFDGFSDGFSKPL